MPTSSSTADGQPIKAESLLFEAISNKDLATVRNVIGTNPKLNLDCLDENELTPLHHVCHNGHLEAADLLLKLGADVNFTKRKDGYTPLMFAAISAKADIVKLLLEHGADTSLENCVNRTAAQMAAFVGQSKIVSIINNWIPFKSSVEPYTKCRELETSPRISSRSLGRLLHEFVTYPTWHPVKLLLFIKSNLDLIKWSNEFIYVLENLSSKSSQNDESLCLKYYFLSYLLEYCTKIYKSKATESEPPGDSKDSFDGLLCEKTLDGIIRRLIKRDEDDEASKSCTKQLDQFIVQCLMKFPYVQLPIFKTMTFALTKREPGHFNALGVLTQSLNGPRTFGEPSDGCSVCGEVDKSKKCSKCKRVYYCSPACQHSDWFQHKKVCKAPDEILLISSDNQ